MRLEEPVPAVVEPPASQRQDRVRAAQFGRAMGELGIEVIPSYSPQARAPAERAGARGRARHGHRERLPARAVLAELRPRFAVPARESGGRMRLHPKPSRRGVSLGLGVAYVGHQEHRGSITYDSMMSDNGSAAGLKGGLAVSLGRCGRCGRRRHQRRVTAGTGGSMITMYGSKNRLCRISKRVSNARYLQSGGKQPKCPLTARGEK